MMLVSAYACHAMHPSVMHLQITLVSTCRVCKFFSLLAPSQTLFACMIPNE